jgi:hypothetical protein
MMPLRREAVGHILSVPRIATPGLMPLLCVTNGGVLGDGERLRYNWPKHLVR